MKKILEKAGFEGALFLLALFAYGILAAWGSVHGANGPHGRRLSVIYR